MVKNVLRLTGQQVMSTQKLNNPEEIRREFDKLFDQSPEEQIEHRAQLLSAIYLSEVEKELDRMGWTRKRLAEEIGTSASYLTQLFRGDRLLNLKTVAKIEQALQITFEIRAKCSKQENPPETEIQKKRESVSGFEW